TTASAFQVNSLRASSGVVTSSNGAVVGSGIVAVMAANQVATTISGNNEYVVTGKGDLAFYPSESDTLAAGGDWTDYSGTVTGNTSITLTTGFLTLNGLILPPGTYTITTSSATLTGTGATSSPNFTGTSSITATNGTINLGPG